MRVPFVDRLGPPLLDRLTLAINHVLFDEPIAMQRLQRHAGRRLQPSLVGLPRVLPQPGPAVWIITPAGLLEVDDSADPEVDLRITVDVGDPMRWLRRGGGLPDGAVTVAGDADLAGSVNWLIENLRWDLERDLARWIGDAPAHQLAGWLTRAADGLSGAMRGSSARSGPPATRRSP